MSFSVLSIAAFWSSPRLSETLWEPLWIYFFHSFQWRLLSLRGMQQNAATVSECTFCAPWDRSLERHKFHKTFQGAHFVHPETEAWRDIKWAQTYFEKLKLCISFSMSPDYRELSLFVHEMCILRQCKVSHSDVRAESLKTLKSSASLWCFNVLLCSNALMCLCVLQVYIKVEF